MAARKASSIIGSSSLALLLLLLIVPIDDAEAAKPGFLNMGINYGRLADNLPSPREAVALIQRMKFGKVKIFDADPHVLSALANTGLQVVIGVSNKEIPSIASSPAAADRWVLENVVAHYPATQINVITVGNEVLSDYHDRELWYKLVPAMQNIHASLQKNNLATSIKVSSASALNTLSNSYPPSAGRFRDDIATSVLQPMLHFLAETRSYFFVNVYPYFTWAQNPQDIPLEYALFGPNADGVQDGHLHYSDLFDAQVDALIAAMARLGYPDVRVAISETGWPTLGDKHQPGASIANAANYNTRLVKKLLAYPPVGTPRRPRTFMPTYLFALFNEDQKPGPTTERNWGLCYPNGTQVYPIDLTGSAAHTLNPPREHRHPPSKLQNQWCVANPKASPTALKTALDYACGQGMSVCDAIQESHSCFQPNTLQSHASYAFNSYWQSSKNQGGSCDFRGAAVLTNKNPSYGSCEYATSP